MAAHPEMEWFCRLLSHPALDLEPSWSGCRVI
jgi:hypothetical protein